jgi:hypothetical protein
MSGANSGAKYQGSSGRRHRLLRAPPFPSLKFRDKRVTATHRGAGMDLDGFEFDPPNQSQSTERASPKNSPAQRVGSSRKPLVAERRPPTGLYSGISSKRDGTGSNQ